MALVQSLARWEVEDGPAPGRARPRPARCSTRTASWPPATASRPSSWTRPAATGGPSPSSCDALLDVLRPHAEALGCGAELAGVAGLMERTGAGAQRELARDGIDAVVPALAARFRPERRRSEDDRLAHGLAAGQAVEALVELVEPEPVGQQPVDGQAPLAVERR